MRWLTLAGRRKVHETKLVWQCLHDEASDLLVNIFKRTNDNDRLRSHSTEKLPVHRSDNATAQRSFRHRGTDLWNKAHAFVRLVTSSTACRKAAYLKEVFEEQTAEFIYLKP